MVEVQTQVRVASGVEAIVVQAADRVEPLDSECNTEVAGPSAQESIDSDTDNSDESIPVTRTAERGRRRGHCSGTQGDPGF